MSPPPVVPFARAQAPGPLAPAPALPAAAVLEGLQSLAEELAPEPRLHVAHVAHKESNVTGCAPMTWEALGELLTTHKPGQKDGPGWLPARIAPGSRSNGRVQAITALCLDVEAECKGDGLKEPGGALPPELPELARELEARGWAAHLASSYKHRAPSSNSPDLGPRYRVVLLLSRELRPEEQKPLADHVGRLLGLEGVLDKSAAQASRFFYLPRAPRERMHLAERASVPGAALPVDELLAHARAAAAPPRPSIAEVLARAGSTEKGEDVIEMFNKRTTIGEVLARHDYEEKGVGRWLWPGSSSGEPGVVLLDSGRVYSHHPGDPLAGPHSLDAFDCFRLLEHGGDVGAAVKAAARALGLSSSSSNSSAKSTSTPAPAGPWGAPAPVVHFLDPCEYPLEALPDTMRAAVLETVGYVQCPEALGALSALAALSASAQALCDVERDSALRGPVGIYTLALASSGERKSTVDALFSRPIVDAERRAREASASAWADFHASERIYEAKRRGALEAVAKASKAATQSPEHEELLRELEASKPKPPRPMRLLYTDATPEALALRLHSGWPAGALLTAEGGLVLGSHGMGRDVITRNLAQLNALWSGESVRIDRKHSESFTLRGGRLTVGLMVQPEVFSDWYRGSQSAGRGSGFLPRFLLAMPESTQGSRMYREPPDTWPALERFGARLTELLEASACVSLAEDGGLNPRVLPLRPDAKSVWEAFHDDTERALKRGARLADIADTASKAAENVARIAALFELLERGPDVGTVSADNVRRAAAVMAWHLGEAVRFFGMVAIPAELQDAHRLDEWLRLPEQQRRAAAGALTLRDAQRESPVRERLRLEAALETLEALERVRLAQERRRVNIAINPALLSG